MVVVMLLVTGGFQYCGKGNATTATKTTHKGEG